MYLQVGDCSHDDCDQGVVDYTHGAAAQKQVRQPRITFSMSHFPRALLAALNCLVPDICIRMHPSGAIPQTPSC